MFDGPILHEGPGQTIIFLDPDAFMPIVGHFNSLFCWCYPIIVDYPRPDGHTTKELAHKNIQYDFGGRV